MAIIWNCQDVTVLSMGVKRVVERKITQALNRRLVPFIQGQGGTISDIQVVWDFEDCLINNDITVT